MRFDQLLCIEFVLVCVVCALTPTSGCAATIYRCIGSDGTVAFQDHACAGGGKQTVLDITSQDPPPVAPAEKIEKSSQPARQQGGYARQRREAEPISFECRTTTGMVFYRHSRCPASLVDGRGSNGKSRRAMVSSQGMDRREACRRMRNGARDGNQFDDRVSTYDRNLGRDTCGRN